MSDIISFLPQYTIEQIQNRLKDKLDTQSLGAMIDGMINELDQLGAELLSGILEEMDMELCQEIKEEGMGTVHERRRKRILTELGEITYTRTYMEMTGTEGGYQYPLDRKIGITPHQRVDTRLQLKIVKEAAEESYRNASRHACGGKLSRMSVCNYVRKTVPEERQDRHLKKSVSVLHIDADEAHTRILEQGRNGKRKSKPAYVPYISAYEGVEEIGSGRKECKNRIDFSCHGLSPDEFCEKALSELEKIYDLENTIIYLHCDGGGWLKTLEEYLPNCIRVLDPYHMQKYCRKMASGLAKEEHEEYSRRIYQAVESGNREQLKQIYTELCELHPDRKATIEESWQYLTNHWEAIRIRQTDPEAKNGCCSEPHVQHLLAVRVKHHGLWSSRNLDHIARYRTIRETDLIQLSESEGEEGRLREKPESRRVAGTAVPNSRGLEDPDQSHSIPLTESRINPTVIALKNIRDGGMNVTL